MYIITDTFNDQVNKIQLLLFLIPQFSIYLYYIREDTC
jgi:hypothetical protein